MNWLKEGRWRRFCGVKVHAAKLALVPERKKHGRRFGQNEKENENEVKRKSTIAYRNYALSFCVTQMREVSNYLIGDLKALIQL